MCKAGCHHEDKRGRCAVNKLAREDGMCNMSIYGYKPKEKRHAHPKPPPTLVEPAPRLL